MQRDFVSIDIKTTNREQLDILVALLTEAGFEGMEESAGGIRAFIAKVDFNRPVLENLLAPMGLGYKEEVLPDKNWNQVWESSFEPVAIGKKIYIRAGFHQPNPTYPVEIIITPKMSFGTGHHATTFLMMERILSLDLQNKKILDFGTGTGILSILAEKLGAGTVLAIDHDDWSITNTRENIELNRCTSIIVEKADEIPGTQEYDYIFANVNRQVILDNLYRFYHSLRPGGYLLLSGILSEDEEIIRNAYFPAWGYPEHLIEKNNWLQLSFIKKKGL